MVKRGGTDLSNQIRVDRIWREEQEEYSILRRKYRSDKIEWSKSSTERAERSRAEKKIHTVESIMLEVKLLYFRDMVIYNAEVDKQASVAGKYLKLMEIEAVESSGMITDHILRGGKSGKFNGKK